MNQFNTPILFIIFNRPDSTTKVFEKIRSVQPRKLFIAADGPRRNNKIDIVNCAEARKIIEKIDWPCEIFTLFSDNNKGCKLAVSGAITWFFSHVEEGIILEDDCLPCSSFFYFCEENLAKYRFDNRIMEISGNNFCGTRLFQSSYTFTRLGGIWGWATWRRAWKLFDVDMLTLSEFIEAGHLVTLFPDREIRNYWQKCLTVTAQGGPSWSYAWLFSIFTNSGLCVTPKYNLVSNIGFGEDSTQARHKASNFTNLPTVELGSIVHPQFIIVDSLLDDEFTKKLIFDRLQRMSLKQRFYYFLYNKRLLSKYGF